MKNIYLNIYNNLIKLTRNKTLYNNKDNNETFSDRLIIFFLHFSFFIKSYKNNSNKREIQELYDFVFKQIELSIREIGYGDASVNKKMKEYINLMYFIIDKVETWENSNLKEKMNFFSKFLEQSIDSSLYINYFDKYRDYLSKKTFIYFTKEVINHKF